MGTALFHQSFATRGEAPNRTSASATIGVGLAVLADLTRGFYLNAELAAQTYLLRELASDRSESIGSSFAGRTTVVLGKHF